MNDLNDQILDLFPLLKFDNSKPVCSFLNHKQTKFQNLADSFRTLNILEEIIVTIESEYEYQLRNRIIPEFWKFFDTEKIDLDSFAAAIKLLYEQFKECQEITTALSKLGYKQNRLDEIFNYTLLSHVSINLNRIIYSYLDKAFKVFSKTKLGDDEDTACQGCNFAECQCENFFWNFRQTNNFLQDMGLLDCFFGSSMTSIVHIRINQYIKNSCIGYDESHISRLETWLDAIVLMWLREIYTSKQSEESTQIEAIKNFEVKLKCHLYEVYACSIVDQFFNIIIEFPDSQTAIDDLNVCLAKIDIKTFLMKTIKESLKTKLLHPGVDTCDILTGYVAAIKTLKYLDKSGVVLQNVIEPVKEYLRNRQDTVRCVVAGLIDDDGPTDLADELAKSELVKFEQLSANDFSGWDLWEPDDVEFENTFHKNRPSDIISMVVDIYGSKELFVIEYRNLLAERLLTQLDTNPDKEIRNLELLKLRFGEALLHSCEVMLKDITDSKRINAHIQNEITYRREKLFDMSAIVLSSQFWPVFKKETIEHPPHVQKQLAVYTKHYEAYKGNRTLCWSPLNGKVQLEIQLGEKNLDFIVTPAQATIILHFENQSIWKINDLSHIMKITPVVLRKRVNFWQTQGIIRESEEGVFTLVEKQDENFKIGRTQVQYVCEDDETESAMASTSDQREEELQVFWSYIVGMLTNLDSLPLERIHQMLKMFASQGPGFEISIEELKSFLQIKVREQKLLHTGGTYQLAKN